MVRFLADDRAASTSKAAPPPSVPLQVLCAGPPRAATSSMQAALERLGFAPCMHMADILPHASRSQLQLEAVRERDDIPRRHKLIRQLLAGHVALADQPVIFFAVDLMDMYPGVKVVLNGRRSSAEWARSARDSFAFFFSWRFWLTGLLFRTDRLWYALNMEAVKFGERVHGNPDIFSPRTYEAHHAWVHEQAAARGIEVLDFMPEQGWGPLCEFLGKEVPAEPYPRLNEKKTFQIVKMMVIAKGLLGWAALGTGLWASWRYGPSALGHVGEWLSSVW